MSLVVGLFANGISLRGSGAPIIFATGLCNVMPSGGYSSLLNLLEKNFSVLTCDSWSALGPKRLREISDTYFAGEKFGYIGHSSLVPSLLSFELIDRVILLDPAWFPMGFDLQKMRFVSRSIHLSKPILVIKAGYSSKAQVPFIPKGFDLKVVNADTVVFDEVGHADLLDDAFASICHWMGIQGTAPLWTARVTRRQYRKDVVNQAIHFFL